MVTPLLNSWQNKIDSFQLVISNVVQKHFSAGEEINLLGQDR